MRLSRNRRRKLGFYGIFLCWLAERYSLFDKEFCPLSNGLKDFKKQLLCSETYAETRARVRLLHLFQIL
jgi:hypothetical protein